MEKKKGIVKKLGFLLKKIKCPRFLHHFGPRKFKFCEHAFALLMKEVLRCSFRRCERLLEEFGIKVPTYSALCRMRKRIPVWIWNSLLKLTSGLEKPNSIAVDSTGFSRSNPSFHYVKRINSKKPVKRFAKLSAFFDLPKRKFCALKVRVRPRHDIKDVSYLLKMSLPTAKLFADSAYDTEFIHKICFEKQIQTLIKPKKEC